MGCGLLEALFASDLATAGDRRMAEGLLAAFVPADVPAAPHICRAPVTAPLTRCASSRTMDAGSTGRAMTQVVRVSREQVESAQRVVKIAGGPDKVDPVIARIVEASPAASVHVES